MTKRVYAEPEAEKLLPLLVSIGREVKNRIKAINELEQKLAAARSAKSAAVGELIAQLANNKRELRLSLTELERLGCERVPGALDLARIAPA